MEAVLPPRPRIYSIDGLEDRVRRWERHNAESLIALACDVPDEGFDALEVNLELPELKLAFVRGTSHSVIRVGTLIEEKPTGSIAVFVALRGEAVFDSTSSKRVIRPGQLVICDPDQPFVRDFGHGLEELAITIPRSRLEAVSGVAELAGPIVVDAGRGHDPYGGALIRLAGRSLRKDAAVPVPEELVVELISMLVAGDRADPALSYRAAAKIFIEENIANPVLSAADVATATGISERHLSRVFAVTAQSVPRYILARRLDTAYSYLTGSDATELRTADVAQACGFTSPAYFSQSFHKRFGRTAGAVRRTGPA
ncbi:helix-turn-helix transcriptional regulator [Nocardia miyunensis]|uniref:helix-turn-helix transcriptional regulator n=1 Tax=Nocardia miyunensis TaxID=282684 RepID=UPI00082C6D7E|nr:AraC family transcriptional regulator [Nocardia miyunensis]